ncbi:hypothetical protein AC249_AIPGENE9241 [Exaiptasia diaphana]|nr:hypothetical protein AC249_AIPGENE9241 [Exaiptasia diaphana]
MADQEKHVEIHGEIYSLDEIPNAETALVVHAKDELLSDLDLKGLVTGLSKLGNCMRIAYNGVAGHTELQIKVQDIGYTITELADKSAVIVHSFKTTSRDVLRELQGAYGYLLDGLEVMAFKTFSNLAVWAEKMANACDELHKEFKAAKEDVREALKVTQTAKDEEEKRKGKLKKQQEEYKVELDRAEIERKDADEAERKAEKLYYEAQKRQDKAYDDYGHVMTTLTDAVTNVFIAFKGVSVSSLNPKNVLEKLSDIGDKSAYKDAMDKAREEKLKHLEMTVKQRETRRKANQQCIEFAERIKNCRSDDELAEMKNYCGNLAGKELQGDVESAMTIEDDAKRLKVWTSPSFKQKAMNYYAKWVALGEVCGTYMLQIKDTRENLYKYLEENPTIEESRENVRDMASTFIKEMKEEQDDIDNENLKTTQKIKDLQPKET